MADRHWWVVVKIFLSGAIGDIFAIEAFFTDKIRESLTTIYYASSKCQSLAILFNALPNYKNLEHVFVWNDWSQFSCFHYKHQCSQIMNELDIDVPQFEEAEDFGIYMIFPLIQSGELSFNNSSWMMHTLCDIFHPLPEHYLVICPYGGTDRENRSFTVSDWEQTLSFLRQKGVQGVVLNDLDQPVPSDPNLIDLSTKTTILEAIEILKKANGYIGVDSSLAALAAKKFPSDKLLIKSIDAHLIEWSRVYYAPHQEVPFLQRQIDTSKLLIGGGS